MFENQENEANQKKAPTEPMLPFRPVSPNGNLVGKVKELGKYEFSLDQKLGSGLTSDAYVGINKENK